MSKQPDQITSITVSKPNDPTNWSLSGVGSIKTPFNMQAILTACPTLHMCWARRPIYLTKAADGSLLVRFLDTDVLAEEGPRA